MRIAVLVLVSLGAGFAAGWFGRAPEPERARTDREAADPAAERRAVIASLTAEEKRAIVERDFPHLVRLEREEKEEAAAERQAEREAEERATEAEAQLLARLRQTMRSQLPQWKTMFGVNAKRAGKSMANKLELSDPLVEKVAAAFDKEGARAAGIAMDLMLAEYEGDPEEAFDAFMWFMGTAGTMSDELTTELAGFLSERDIGAIREEMRVRHEDQLDQQAEMQLRMMGLPDLSEQQTTELKEMFSDGGMMKEQGKVWAEIMRNPRAILEAKSEADWMSVLEPSMRANRERIRPILDDKQFEAYRRYEKQAVSQFRMWVEPMIQGAR